MTLSRSPSPQQLAKRRRLALLAAEQAQPPPKKPQVAITDVTAVAVREPSGGPAYVLLTIQTDAGVSGIGELLASANRPQTTVEQVLSLKRYLLRQDALGAEVLGQYLKDITDNLEGKQPGLLAALNMALLDILGKVAKAPLYEVLGGPTRSKVRALANVRLGQQADLSALYKGGFRAVAIRLTPGQVKNRGPAFYRRFAEQLHKLRQELGDDADFAIADAGWMTPADAVGVARAVERLHPLFFDPPGAPPNIPALRKVAEESVVPLGLGHGVSDVQPFADWLREQVVDILRPDLSLLGVSAIRKAAALAETYYAAVAPHHQAGPVTTAAGLHLAATLPNFFILEVPVPADAPSRQMRRALIGADTETPEGGFLALPAGPGLGVTLHADAIEKYRVKP